MTIDTKPTWNLVHMFHFIKPLTKYTGIKYTKQILLHKHHSHKQL